MSNGENLGPPVPWQIRDIPQAIRDAVVDQARVEKVKVPELLTRLVLDAQQAGWTFAGFDRFANTSNSMADPGAMQRAQAVLAMAADMGRAGVPVQKGLAAALNRLVKREAQAVLGLAAPERHRAPSASASGQSSLPNGKAVPLIEGPAQPPLVPAEAETKATAAEMRAVGKAAHAPKVSPPLGRPKGRGAK